MRNFEGSINISPRSRFFSYACFRSFLFTLSLGSGGGIFIDARSRKQNIWLKRLQRFGVGCVGREQR